MYHYSLCFAKEGEMKFISHLDMLRTFIRALRRASIPVIYSQGFNPVPRLTFAAPLAVGMAGKNEYLDLFLNDPWEETHLKEALNKQLPPGLKIKSAAAVDANQPTISSVIGAALYVAHLPDAEAAALTGLQSALEKILQKKTLTIFRLGKKGVAKKSIAKNGIVQEVVDQNGITKNGIGQEVVDQKGIAKNGIVQKGVDQNGIAKNGIVQKGVEQRSFKEVNIRPFIYHLGVKTFAGAASLLMLLATGSQGGVRPGEVLGLLPLCVEPRVYRQDLFLWEEEKLKTPAGASPAYYFGENPMGV